MMRLELINKDNIKYAIKLENEIFPEYNAKNNYYDSLKDVSNSKFFLIYDDAICVGISGLYWYKTDKDNVWLGFFGIKEEYRRLKYGNRSLKLTEEYAKKLGYKFMRLFTDKLDNYIAINFYINNGYTFEDYNSNEEILKNEFNVVIGSKSLCKENVKPWNNKFINLSKQTKKQI